MFNSLGDIHKAMDMVREKIVKQEDRVKCIPLVREYVRLTMMRHAVKLQEDLTGTADFRQAEKLANQHIKEMVIS